MKTNKNHIINEIKKGKDALDTSVADQMFSQVSMKSGLISQSFYQKALSMVGKKTLFNIAIGSLVLNSALTFTAFNYYQKSKETTTNEPIKRKHNLPINKKEKTVIISPESLLIKDILTEENNVKPTNNPTSSRINHSNNDKVIEEETIIQNLDSIRIDSQVTTQIDPIKVTPPQKKKKDKDFNSFFQKNKQTDSKGKPLFEE